MYENFDLTTVVTPIKPAIFKQLLEETGYSEEKIKFLTNGFEKGFSINYNGPTQGIQKTAKNLKLRVGSKTQLWNKVMKEVKLNRFAGPFEKPPFDNFIQSPIGLVDKDQGRDTRLIFHLSYPRDDSNSSVNTNTPDELCHVKYVDFDEAIALCLSLINDNPEQTVFVGKSDYKSAFRNVGLDSASWPWLVLMAESPIDGKQYFFVDKCLPFGHSISCALFQEISDAIAHIVQIRVSRRIINYLDDYLFVSVLRSHFQKYFYLFVAVCSKIRMPVSDEKTFWAEEMMTFLGLLIDGHRHLVLIPIDKVAKANSMIEEMLKPGKKKVTVLRLQQICGFLNFLCRCIVPGRAFTRRIYSYIPSKLRPHHHVRISGEMRMDFSMWRQFLAHPSVFSRPFADFGEAKNATDLNLFTDALRNFSLGCGGLFNQRWFFIGWDLFTKLKNPSIEYLELYTVAIAVKLWARFIKNRKIYLFCDNESAVAMINSASSTCHNCMVLIRIITLEGLIHNVKIMAKHVRTELNGKADAISRRKFALFRKLVPDANTEPEEIPEELWPLSKIWLDN